MHTKLSIQSLPVKILLVLIFIFSFYGQILLIDPGNTTDHSLWASQAKYFETNNPQQYNILWAYGHPGGPLIIGTLITKHILPVSYETALTLTLALISALLMTLLSYILHRLSPHTYWWLLTPLLLTFHHSYIYNTPPSMLTMILTALQFFYTVFLYSKKQINTKHALLFGILGGIAIATRTDMGGIMSLVCGLLLLRKFSPLGICTVFVSALGFFLLTDPFMWYMPIQHIHDLIYKMTYHYKDFGYVHFGIQQLFLIATPACMSMIFFIYLWFQKKIDISFSKTPLLTFFILTLTLGTLFLTSDYKAARYFFPMIIVWEILFVHFIERYGEHLKSHYPLLHISRYTYILLTIYIALGLI